MFCDEGGLGEVEDETAIHFLVEGEIEVLASDFLASKPCDIFGLLCCPFV